MTTISPARRSCLIVLFVTLATGCPSAVQPVATDTGHPREGLERKAEKGPVHVTVRVTPAEPRLSDLVEMLVDVEAPAEVEIKPPVFGQSVGDFLIRDYGERPAPDGQGLHRRFRYQLEPTFAGLHLIRSVAIEFIDRRASSEARDETLVVETDPLEIPVTSELPDGPPNLADLEPMLPPEPLPAEIAPGIWLAIVGTALVLAVIGAWWRRRKLRDTEPPRRTPEDIANTALSALLAENLPARGQVKEFFLRLTGIVRNYIEDTTGIRAPEQTTEEFLRDVRSSANFPPECSTRLAEFLVAADMIKYAGQQPGPGQIEDSVARAREFVAAPMTEACSIN